MGRVIIIMGVSACGKSTVGKRLFEMLKEQKCTSTRFLDGDDFHNEENRKKMSRGEPLSDEDRHPWLDDIARVVSEAVSSDSSITVIACSALKAKYRAQLVQGCASSNCNVIFVHLALSLNEALGRSTARSGHFAAPTLVKSQFDTLEPISGPENELFQSLVVEADHMSVDDICCKVIVSFSL